MAWGQIQRENALELLQHNIKSQNTPDVRLVTSYAQSPWLEFAPPWATLPLSAHRGTSAQPGSIASQKDRPYSLLAASRVLVYVSN